MLIILAAGLITYQIMKNQTINTVDNNFKKDSMTYE